MATAADESVVRLQRNLARIPQELYDEILDLVLTPTAFIVTIDEMYRPPPQIHISRATRTVAATRYYTNTAFILHEGEGREDVWLQWLQSLPHEHVRMMNTYYKLARKDPIDQWEKAVCLAYWAAEAMWGLAAYVRRPIDPKNLFTNFAYKDDDGSVMEVWKDGDFLVEKWIENGAPFFLRARSTGFDPDYEDSEDGEVGYDSESAGDDGVASGDEKDESDGEVEESGKTRFASKNPFDLLAG